MNAHELARDLAKLGPVLPVNGKIPLWREWQKRASQHVNGDPEWLSATGVGLLTGKRAGFWVLDVDGSEGAETLAAWERENGKLPRSWVSRTGSGGLHFFFRCPSDFLVHGSARKLGPGIDVRGEGGQVVAAGSRHASGSVYAWEPGAAPADVELAEAPEWLQDMLRPAEPVRLAPALPSRQLGADVVRRASAYLAKIAPAISGNGGHAQTLLAAEHLVLGFSLDEEAAFSLLWGEYNPRCEPPWSEKDLRHKIREAGVKGTAVRRGQHLERDERAPAAVVQLARQIVKEDAPPLFLPVDDFFALCSERVQWVLEPYIPKGGFILVSGAPKGGKTFFLGWLACEIAAAGKTVLFVEEEGAKETLRARLEPFKRPGMKIHVSHRNGWKLDDERSVNRLIEEAKAVGADVLFLDPLNMIHAHARQIGDVPAEVIQAIQRIIRETGCAIVLACHTRKGASWDKDGAEEAQSADVAGSYAWAASADNIIQIKGVPAEERRTGEVRFYVENPDTRNGEPFPKRLAVVRLGARGEPDAMTIGEPKGREALLLAELLPFIPESAEDAISVEQVRKASGKGKTVIQAAIALGERTGVVVRRLNGRGIYRGETTK